MLSYHAIGFGVLIWIRPGTRHSANRKREGTPLPTVNASSARIWPDVPSTNYIGPKRK